MTTCLIPGHIAIPDLKHCSTCRKEYEEYLLRNFGPHAVDLFRAEMQLEAIRRLT